jgi:hypothetical protein
MKSKVFLSCGQHSAEERAVASAVEAALKGRGFDVYVAVQVATILEINERIIRELKNSDCFLLINFRREKLAKHSYRGSLFSNQELAIAYSLGFERLLVVNQADVASEGMLRYIGVNTETFADYSDCCAVVEAALNRAAWKSDYSRRLRAGAVSNRGPITFGSLSGQFYYVAIYNGRPDIAALECTARLARFRRAMSVWQPSPILSPLKATGRPGYSHTIFPSSPEEFDLFVYGTNSTSQRWGSPLISGGVVPDIVVPPTASGAVSVPMMPYSSTANPGSGAAAGTPLSGNRVYLNSALDYAPLPYLPITQGRWNLEFEFVAIGFPMLTVEIELDVTPSTCQASLVSQEIR